MEPGMHPGVELNVNSPTDTRSLIRRVGSQPADPAHIDRADTSELALFECRKSEELSNKITLRCHQ